MDKMKMELRNILKRLTKFWSIAALPFGLAMVDLTITSEII